MIYQAEKVLREHADRIPPDVKTEIDTKMEALKEATKGGDVSTLRRTMDEFNEALQKVGQHIYQEAGATSSGGQGPQGGGQPGEEKSQDDVVDADYREV
jgi:molecular chaperone DnaK